MAKKKINGKIFELLTTLSRGDSFYVDSPPRTVTSYATKYNVRVRTRSVLIIEEATKVEPTVKKITKVTLI